MRPHLLAAALFLCPVAAHAGMTIRQATEEARSFLPPCRYSDADQDGLCATNQLNFTEEYVRALAGDHTAQDSTMSSFSRIGRDPIYDLGEPTNQVLACAWAGVILTETPRADLDRPMARDVVADQCRPLGRQAMAVAVVAATKLQRRLRTDPVHLPPHWTLGAAR